MEHFRRYVGVLATRFAPRAGQLAMDIGEQRWHRAALLARARLSVCGIDPAEEIAREATANGLPTRCAYFTAALGRNLRMGLWPAAFVTANNIFAHADELPGILDGVRELLDDAGVFVFEVSYLIDIIERKHFDTVFTSIRATI